MAKSDAVKAETLEVAKLEKTKKARQKCRLIADPYIQVWQIQTCLEGYMSYMKTSDLWSLVNPPACKLACRSQCSMVGQTSNLLYDVLDFAPNTKLQGTKVTKALQATHLNKSLFIDKKLKPEDAIDRMSLSLRIVLSMLKTKMSECTKSNVMRKPSNEEAMKLNIVLTKVVLPAECFGANGHGEEFAEEDSVEPLDLQPRGLALVFDQSQKAKKGKMEEKNGNKGKKAKPAKQVQQKTQKQTKAEKTSKAKQTKDHGPEASSPKPNAPEYKVDVYPTEKDTYRNLYTSRHHNKAKALALKRGLSMDVGKAWGRKAAAEESAMWDEVHAKDAEPYDVD